MASCKTNRKLIEEKIFTEAFEIDENVTVIDDRVTFSSVEKFDEFVKKIHDEYDIDEKSIIYENRDFKYVIIDDTSTIEETLEFESPHILSSVSFMTNEYHADVKQLDFYRNYVSKINRKIEEINVIIRKYRDILSDSTQNKSIRDNAVDNIKQYSIVLSYLREQVKKIDSTIPSMSKQLFEIKGLFEYVIMNFDYIKDQNLVEMMNNIFDDTIRYMNFLGSKEFASRNIQSISEEEKIKIKNLRNDINTYKLDFDRKINDSVHKFLLDDPILNAVSSYELNIKKILENPQSEEYKRMFGGAAISDIGFLQRLFLNVDTSTSFDGLIPQLLMNEFDMIGQDNMNESIKNKKRMLEFSKKLKSHGINLEDPKDTDFLMEKDGNGNLTGNLISIFTPEFRKKKSDFFDAQYDRRTADLLQMIKNDFDCINIFKFGFIHDPDIKDKDNLDTEFYRCCKEIFKEKGENFEKYLSENEYDSEYEKKMRDTLGDKMVDEMISNFQSVVIEFYHGYRGSINNNSHIDPFVIISSFNNIKNGIINIQSKNKKVHRFTSLPLIPNSDKGYNKDFRKNFIEDNTEKGKLLKEFYSFLYDSTTMFQLMYAGKNSLRLMFLEENSVDNAVDALKGIVKLDDVSGNLRKLKKNSLQWIGDKFWDNNYISSDETQVSRNYSDTAAKKFSRIKEIISMKSEEEVRKMGENVGIYKKDYSDNESFNNAVAKKISMDGYNRNFYEVMMKSFDLYYAQKTRNEIYPIAKMLQRKYMQYTNEKGNKRENADARMHDFIMRAIQKINLDNSDKANEELSNITIIRNMLSRFDQMPVVSKFLNSKLMKKMTDDEKELLELLKKSKEDIDGTSDITFEYENNSYMRKMSGGKLVYFRTFNGNDRYEQLTSEYDINDFKEKYIKMYDNKISQIGCNATLQNVINLIQNLLLYKLLGGVSTSGIFNRIEGHLANAEMDATGYWWTPGNLNYVEQYFLGAGLQRYITKTGEKTVEKYIKSSKDSQWIKRLDIIRKISEQTNIFQDMKNQYDKTIEGVQKGVKRHNFDLFQLSVSNPEFKNQMTVVLARLMDEDIKDKNGKIHKIFDKKTGEFTCFDIVDNELVLKEEFNIPENESWISFKSIYNDSNGKRKSSPSFIFAQQCKIAIKEIHGDYRKNSALGYNNNIVLRSMMSLKRWMPSKVVRGWSKGGSTINGEFQQQYELMKGGAAQSGVWYDVVTKSKGPMMLLPLLLSTVRLHKGVLKTLVGSAGSLYMFCSVAKNKLGARKGQISSNVSMLEESVEMLKAVAYETAIFIPRNLPRIFGKKFDFDTRKHSFTNKKFKDEYGEITLGNFRACARQTATYLYISLLGILAKLLFWNPDDGDEDERRKKYNWIDNNLDNILDSTTATLFMIDNIEDKAEVSNIPIIRWINDVQKFVVAFSDMDGDKIMRYGEKAFMPIRFPVRRNGFNPFESDFEYQKDTWDDRLIKNIKTDGEWGAEQDYKHIRADIKKQYVEMWKDKELPDFAIESLSRQLKAKGYKNVYDASESEIKDMISKSNLIPSRKQKQYKKNDYKMMHDILMKEYDDNPYLKNHALKYIFGGYDNRIGSYFQRCYNSDYEIVRDNPYIDDGD